MAPVARVACRTVAPLLARFNDPDLTEAEQVLLSTHLLGCPACRARLHEYRAIDRRVRALPSLTLAPRVRAAVLDQVALSGGGAVALSWRQARTGAAMALSLTTFLMVAGLTMALVAQGAEARLAAGAGANAMVARPLATTFLAANPTRVVNNLVAGEAAGGATGNVSGGEIVAYRLPIAKAQATRPAAVGATIRAINPLEGRIVVTIDGARGDERLVILRDTAILLADGRPGRLTDLAVGAQIELQRETNTVGTIIAREIVVSR